MMKYILILATFCSSFLAAQNPYFPDKNWETRKPFDLNMNAAFVDSAVNFALSNEVKMDYDLRIANIKSYSREPDYKILGPMRHRGKPAGLIIKNGYIVAKWGDIDRVDMTFSVTKSYLSTIAGLAFDNKLIQNVDEPVAQYVWDGTFDGAHNASITWRHLLTQSSDWSGCQFGTCDWADRPPKEGGIDDWRSRKLNLPGTKYQYNDTRVNVLAYSLLQVWRKPLPQILKEKIMDSIGASTTWRWFGYDNAFVNVDGTMMQSVSGGGHFGGGIFINTLDQARFGLLFLRHGKWKNQRILSEKWIDMARQPSTANKSYGFMWWLNEEGNTGDFSKKVYSANGFGGNFIVIDEEHDLVIVTRWLEPNQLGAFVKKVIQAAEKGK